MGTFTYRGLDIDVGSKKAYFFSQEIYEAGGLKVLVTPISRRLAIFHKGKKVTDDLSIQGIMDRHYVEIKKRKEQSDSEMAKALSDTDRLNQISL
ncbi:MAG: hypothetical protein JW754_01970 [Candidatus Aenigmarchaeota archaeon]|nr:hypothetical protein [Candidatus Aenigmarchaeota archaeon]